jgi:hypothetical protein
MKPPVRKYRGLQGKDTGGTISDAWDIVLLALQILQHNIESKSASGQPPAVSAANRPKLACHALAGL